MELDTTLVRILAIDVLLVSTMSTLATTIKPRGFGRPIISGIIAIMI